MSPWSLAEQRAREAMDLLEKAQAERSLAHLKRAAGLLRSAIEVVPTDAGWHSALGDALAALGDFRGATKAFTEAASIEPGQRGHTLKLANLQVRTGDAEAALKTIDAILAEDASIESARCLRVEALGRLGRFADAEDEYYLAREYVEECPRCDMAMVRSLLAKGDPKRGLPLPRRMEKAGIQGLELAFGQAHLTSGDISSAVTSLQAATAAEPRDPAGWLGLGVALDAAGQVAAAGEALRRAEKLAPKVPQIQGSLARSELSRGSLRLAVRHARKALSLNPTEPTMRLILARHAFSRNNIRLARGHLLAERKHAGNLSAPALFDLATLLTATLLTAADLPVAARRTWRLVTLAAPSQASAWQNLAVACFEAGRFAQGERATARGIKADPRCVDLYFNLALQHIRLRRLADAHNWIVSGLTVAPNDESLKRLRRRLQLVSAWRRTSEVLARSTPGRWLIALLQK